MVDSLKPPAPRKLRTSRLFFQGEQSLTVSLQPCCLKVSSFGHLCDLFDSSHPHQSSSHMIDPFKPDQVYKNKERLVGPRFFFSRSPRRCFSAPRECWHNLR